MPPRIVSTLTETGRTSHVQAYCPQVDVRELPAGETRDVPRPPLRLLRLTAPRTPDMTNGPSAGNAQAVQTPRPPLPEEGTDTVTATIHHLNPGLSQAAPGPLPPSAAACLHGLGVTSSDIPLPPDGPVSLETRMALAGSLAVTEASQPNTWAAPAPDPGLAARFIGAGIEPRWALVVAAAYLMDVS